MEYSVASECSQSYKTVQIKYVQINPVSVLSQATPGSECKRCECVSPSFSKWGSFWHIEQ